MRAREFLTELRDQMFQYIKSLLPTWPDYVLKDWIYGLARGDHQAGVYFKPDADFGRWGFNRETVFKMITDAGLSPDTKWQLIPNMKFTMDMFDPNSKRKLIGRAGGSSDMGMGIPKDAERHATQAALAQQQGGIRKEPVILIKTPQGYELLEGWHRTIQHFARYPDGYVGPAYVAVAQSKPGITESMAADQVLDYVKRTHAPEAFDIEYSITDHPEWELKTIPLSQLNLDPDGETPDPYNRVNWVDDDKVQELIPRIRSVLKSSPIVVDPAGWIIDGNHRAMAAVEAGLTSVPALVPVKQDMAEGTEQKPVVIYTNHRGATIDDDIKKSLRTTQEPFNKLQMWEKHKSMKDPKIADWVTNKLLPELKQNGVLKPLLVWNNNGQLFVIDGNHRFLAYQEAGYRGRVPVQIVPDNMIIVSDTVPGQQGVAEGESNDTAISLSKLGKFHPGADTLAQFVPERATARYALHPDKWESTFYSLTNKDSDKLKYYGPKKISIPPGTLVGDMAIANKFYRAKTPEEKQQYAELYKASLQPYPVDVSAYRMPELLIPRQGMAEEFLGEYPSIETTLGEATHPDLVKYDKNFQKQLHRDLDVGQGKGKKIDIDYDSDEKDWSDLTHIQDYTGGSVDTNDYLHRQYRNKAKVKELTTHQAKIQALDRILANHKLPQQIVVYTGLRQSPAEAWETYGADVTKPIRLHLPAYTSTTTKLKVALIHAGEGEIAQVSRARHKPRNKDAPADEWGTQILMMTLPAGLPAASVKKISEFPRENEILLPRGMDIEINPRPTVLKGGDFVWHATVLSHSPVQIAPPMQENFADAGESLTEIAAMPANQFAGGKDMLGVAENKQPGKPVVDAILKVMPLAQEIWFHGSRAIGQHRNDSDTDILVVVPDDLVGDKYLGVVRILQKLSSHFDNHDIQPTKAGTNIHRIAQEEGRLLWSKNQGVAEDTQLPGDFKLMGQNLFLKNLARNLKQRYPDATVKLLNDRVTAYHNEGDDEALSVMGTEVMDSGYIGVGLDDAFTESFQGVLVPTIKQTTEQLLQANPGTKPALFISDNNNPDAWTHIATKLGYRLVVDDEPLDEGANWDDEEDALVEALESWMMMDYDDQTIKTILSSPEAEPYKDPPGGVQWLYRAIVPRDREMNSIRASGPVIAFATEMAGAITFIESLETSDDWVIVRKPFDPADFLLDFTAMYEDIVEPDQMSRYEVEDEVWMKAVPAYTKANKQEIVYTSKEHYGDDDWRKDDYKPKSTSKSNLRRPEAEPVIMRNPGEAYQYARDVIKGRWPEAEPYIIQGANSNDKFSIGISIIVNYARDVIGGRWPEAEPVIMKNPEYAYQYARDVIGGRWPKAEPYIMKDPVWALFYAEDVIKARWPEAEPIIMKSRRSAEYAKLFNLDTPAQDMAENFADGKKPGRKGLAKRSGVNTKASVSSLRKTAKNSSGEKQRMAHWLANMKAGRAKAKKK